jgi:hypothetical protein
MKNLSNRIQTIFIAIFCLGITLIFNGCRDDDSPPNCGCEANTIKSIPKSSTLTGKIFYKAPSPKDDYYTNKFWIVYTEPSCVNCAHHFIICNEKILENNYNEIKEVTNGKTIDITFSGNIKPICDLPNAWLADETFERITLTSIERK